MKLARLSCTPAALIDFYEEGLEALGAICERTWHDRLHVLAEGPAARLWDGQGTLLETELYFVPPGDPGVRHAEREVFPGCPLTFRLAEELRPRPLTLERCVVQSADNSKPPSPELAEKIWHAQMPGTSRWRLEGVLAAHWHFSLLALARGELQAIDQHWSLHRLAVSLADGRRDEALATGLAFLSATEASADIPWPQLDWAAWEQWIKAALMEDLQADLVSIRERQKRYLQRELNRIDSYFEQYKRELGERQRRAHADASRLKAEERLAAAQSEHERRRQDQLQRHEIRVVTHVDALVLLAEPAWRGSVSWWDKGERQTKSALFIPRSRRWVA